MRPLVSIAVCVAFGCPVRATSIVAVRTPSAIFIGSDSKLVDGDRRDVGTVCKIVASKGVYFGIARIWGSPAQGFSVRSIAAQAMNTKGDLSSKVSHFEKLLVPPLEHLLVALRNSDPGRFDRELYGHRAVDSLFVGFEDGRPALVVRSFIVKRVSRHIVLEIRREQCLRDCTGLAYVTLGEHQAIDQALTIHPDFWKIGVANGIRALINLEISEAPELVGAPISILSIDKSGSHWIEQGTCQYIK